MGDSLGQGKAYVEKMRAGGKSEDEIRSTLQQAGWQAEQIRGVLGPPPEEDTRDLCQAAREGAAGRVQYLLMRGEDPNRRDAEGPALMHAIMGHQPATVAVLLQWNANVHHTSADGRTAMHLAAVSNDTAVVDQLLATGVDVDMRDMSRATALHVAADANLPEMVAFLVDHHAAVNVDDDRGRTALHRAADKGHQAVVAVLLEAGADVDNADSMGRTPLHLAAKAGHADMCRQLMSGGAHSNAQDNSGKTPLAVAEGPAKELLSTIGAR